MKIKVLSKDVSELISAGEVIERPSSVIKEIVENSIDAGARHITVEIKKGGTTFMRVTDDGCGMEFDDVPTAFLRHATSKINNKNDLDNILTFGFRGEALASVSAVAKVDVTTKRIEDEYGTLYKIEGSEEKLHEKTGCPDGTTIIIRDLFFNVPVRRNFMKKDVTEGNSISKIVQKTALSHPEVSFKFIRENKIEFNSDGNGDLYSAIYAVYGKDFAKDLIQVDHTENNIKISGFVIKPLYAKANRTFQNFFVNGRYVKSFICQTALESAYENLIMTGKFPACVLMIDIAPSTIDVNIHPSKAEIRFSDEKKVSDAIYFAIKNSMLNNGLIYEFQLKDVKQEIDEPVEISDFLENSIFTKPEDVEKVENQITNELTDEDVKFVRSICPPFPFKPIKDENAINPNLINEADIFIEPELEPEPKSEPVQEDKNENFNCINEDSGQSFFDYDKPPNIRVVGEAFENYIIALTDDTIVIMDKHASHERVIFERLKSQNCRQYIQLYMTQEKILLSDDEFDVMQSNNDRLEGMGFSLIFSQKPYVIPRGVPSFLIDQNMSEIIPEIARNFLEFKHNPQSHVIDDMFHTMACKGAIKAHDKNSLSELQKLANIVYNDENIRHCPHGRPVMFTITQKNLEKQFKRKL